MKNGFSNIIGLILLAVSVFSPSCKTETGNIPFYLGSGDFYGEYYPTQSWQMCSPENVGMDSEKLEDVFNYVSNKNINTYGILIIKKGYIVLEAYFRGFTDASRHESYSVAKSFTSSIIGIAKDNGYIEDLEEKILKYFPELNYPGVDQRKQRLTIKNLLSMMSGIDWKEEGEYSHEDDDAFIMMNYDDFPSYVLNKAISNEPGTVWNYSSGDTVLLSGIIEKATGISLFEFAKRNLFNRIGLDDIEWDSDNAGHTIGAWGIHATLREYAKFGYLYLQKGKWEGVQIVPEKWINESLKPVFPPKIDFYGYQWWLGRSFENFTSYDLPDDIYLAWGLYTQQIFIIPSHQMVVVRFGRDPYSSYDQWDEAEFISLVLKTDK